MVFKNRNYLVARYTFILAVLGGLLGSMPVVSTHAQTIVYRVASGGTISGSCGADWSNPCGLQYVLNVLAYEGTGVEVWVKSSLYSPGEDRTDTFELRNGVAIYGGFT